MSNTGNIKTEAVLAKKKAEIEARKKAEAEKKDSIPAEEVLPELKDETPAEAVTRISGTKVPSGAELAAKYADRDKPEVPKISDEQAAKLQERIKVNKDMDAGVAPTERKSAPKVVEPSIERVYYARIVHEAIATLELATRGKQLGHWEDTTGAYQEHAIAAVKSCYPEDAPALWQPYISFFSHICLAIDEHLE